MCRLCVCVWGEAGLCCVAFYFRRPKTEGLGDFLKHSPCIQRNYSLQLIKGIWRMWTFLRFEKCSTPIVHFVTLTLLSNGPRLIILLDYISFISTLKHCTVHIFSDCMWTNINIQISALSSFKCSKRRENSLIIDQRERRGRSLI